MTTIGRYRKKPIVVDAMQVNDYNDAMQAQRWMSDHGEVAKVNKLKSGFSMFIPTLEGKMRASAGDWIIQGVNGEFYPCKPDVFDATYEVPENA